jgi:hypothetical protein
MIKRFMAWLKSIYLKPAVQASKQETAMSNFILVLSTTTNGAVADGSTANSLQVKVTDSTGVAAAAQTVILTSDAAVIINPASVLTDANGVGTVSLTSSTAGTYAVTATLADGTTVTGTVLFGTAVTTDPEPVGPIPANPAVDAAPQPDTLTQTSALAEFKANAIAEIEKFAKFVEHGIEVLGANAEVELVALKDKYL